MGTVKWIAHVNTLFVILYVKNKKHMNKTTQVVHESHLNDCTISFILKCWWWGWLRCAECQ